MASGISPQLKTQVRNLLMDCEQFESNKALRSIFDDSRISGWKDSLPEADNRAGRVDRVISFLLEKSTADDNILSLFLRVLSEQFKAETKNHRSLFALAQEIELSMLEPEIREVLQNLARFEDTGMSAEWQLFGEKNEGQLRAVFDRSDLRCWGSQASPNAFEAAKKVGVSSSAYRANAVFDFLKDKTHPTNGQNGVALLLRVLAQRTKSAYEKDKLERLAQKIEEVTPSAPHAPLPMPAPAPIKPDPQPAEAYTDIEFHVLGATGDVYPVTAELSDGSSFSGELRLDESTRQALALSGQSEDELLSQALFAGEMDKAYSRAETLAEAKTGGRLRLRLWIDNAAAELHALRWERLCYRRNQKPFRLATTAARPFSRYFGLSQADPEPLAVKPIRVLAVFANPRNLGDYHLAPLDVENEIAGLLDALDPFLGSVVELTLLAGSTSLSAELQGRLAQKSCRLEKAPASLDALLDVLAHPPDYHVLHFLGHGVYSGRRKQAALYFEDQVGNAQIVSDKSLAEGLHDVGQIPHLVFLAACDSAKREVDANPFVGLAPRLIQVGVPAVVAMQDAISLANARTLTYHFYRFLFEHGVVDKAINQARRALVRDETRDYAIPALFTRLKAGRLFNFTVAVTVPVGNPTPIQPPSAPALDVDAPPLERAKRTLAILENQAAAYTVLTIPAHLQIELEEQRKKVAALMVAQ